MTKKWDMVLILGLLLAVVVSVAAGFDGECDPVRQNVLRLHILANSDSEQDQALKLQVRDAVLRETAGSFEAAESLDTAEQTAAALLPRIEETARQTLAAQGCDDAVRVSLVNMYFETREYDGHTLPAGYYDAVRIELGAAAGHNWWCVMYPSLCVPAACDNYDSALDDSERDIVENYPKYEIKFKSVEVFEWLKNALS